MQPSREIPIKDCQILNQYTYEKPGGRKVEDMACLGQVKSSQVTGNKDMNFACDTTKRWVQSITLLWSWTMDTKMVGFLRSYLG